ncbi:unnamed protein product [Absidia cylindrospora]
MDGSLNLHLDKAQAHAQCNLPLRIEQLTSKVDKRRYSLESHSIRGFGFSFGTQHLLYLFTDLGTLNLAYTCGAKMEAPLSCLLVNSCEGNDITTLYIYPS